MRYLISKQRVAMCAFVVAVAVTTLIPVASAQARVAVVKQFRVAVTSESTEYRGGPATLIKRIVIRGRDVRRARVAVKCNQRNCVRLVSGSPLKKVVGKTSVAFNNVNWVVTAGQTFTVAVHRRKRIGRFVRLGVNSAGESTVTVKKSGCLRRGFKRRRCPKGTKPLQNDSVSSPQVPPRSYFKFAGQWTFDWAPGAGTDLQPITGDFNGDGVDDIGLRRVSSGMWYFRPGPGFGSQWTYNWGAAGTHLQPITGDFNGDGVDDIGLRRVSSGLWYFRPGPHFGSQWTFDWAPGAGTDLQPITGDFNGDGVDDIGLRRVSSGMWYFRPGPGFGSQWTYNWGAAGTHLQPIKGSFNGDKVDEIGLRRVSNGLWYFRPGPTFDSQFQAAWEPGAGEDLQPIEGDFNGDGVDEIGLRRISSGMWYFRPG